MANVYANLPVPAADGVGAGVSTATMGKQRTVTVKGSFFDAAGIGAAITIEVSANNVNYAPLFTFTKTGKRTFNVAALWMRVRVSGTKPGVPVAANVDVGSWDTACQAVTPAVPAGNGTGAATNISALGSFNTAIVVGTFTGSILIEVSEDSVDWTAAFSFTNEGLKSKVFTAQFVRVTRAGVDLSVPGTAVVTLCAADDFVSSGLAAHDMGGVWHTADALADINTKVSDDELAGLQKVNEWEAANWNDFTTLDGSGANTEMDAEDGNTYKLPLEIATTQLDNPDNMVAGMRWDIVVVQDNPARALTFDTYYKFGDAGAPNVSADLTADKRMMMYCLAFSTTEIFCTYELNF